MRIKLSSLVISVAAITVFQPAIALANTIEVCRPLTNNPVQLFGQFVNYSYTPMCRKPKKGDIELRLNNQADHFRELGSNPEFRDRNGNLYRQQGIGNVFIRKQKSGKQTKK